MSTGREYTQHEKQEAVDLFEALGRGSINARIVAEKYGVHFTTIYAWAKNGQNKALTSSESDQFETLFKDFLDKRSAVQTAYAEMQEAKNNLETFIKELK